MAWASMHFATGMTCAGALSTLACLSTGRGWRWVPLAMTLGGIWALVPDMPRFFYDDFPNAPLAAYLGNKQFEATLKQWGDLFFFHRALDAQPREHALVGLGAIIGLYNLTIVYLLWRRHPQSVATSKPDIVLMMNRQEPLSRDDSSMERSIPTGPMRTQKFGDRDIRRAS